MSKIFQGNGIDIFNVQVWGIREALLRAKYPMETGLNMDMDYDTRTIEDLLDLGGRLGGSPIGHGDDKFLRQIKIGFDLLVSRYFLQQFQTYHHTEINSMSTMHKGKKFDYDFMANKHVDEFILYRFKDLLAQYNADPTEENFLRVKSNMPEGIRIGIGVTSNYAQLKTMYYQRKTHRLPEWRDFCSWIETLPYANELRVTAKYATTCVAKEGKA